VYDTGDGFLYYINEQPSSSWTLLWRKELSPSRLESLWPAVQNIAQQGTMQWLRIKSGRAVPPRTLVRQPEQNETAGGAADGLFECQFAAEAAGSPGLVFRQSDAANYWKLVVNRAANTVDLVKVVAGAATTVGTTALTLAAGTQVRLRALCFGDKIRTWHGLTPCTNATDSFNQTATGIGTLGDATYALLRADTGGVLPD
jgi:hypothetical protein